MIVDINIHILQTSGAQNYKNTLKLRDIGGEMIKEKWN
jgi:hypothetical protein